MRSILLALVEGVSDKVWILVGAGLLALIVLAIVLLVVARRRPAPPADPGFGWDDAAPLPEPAVSDQPADVPADEAWPEMEAGAEAAAPEPAPEPVPVYEQPAADAPVHYCRCPACQTQFSVSGQKPIVTNCPGCGKKGYLR